MNQFANFETSSKIWDWFSKNPFSHKENVARKLGMQFFLLESLGRIFEYSHYDESFQALSETSLRVLTTNRGLNELVLQVQIYKTG